MQFGSFNVHVEVHSQETGERETDTINLPFQPSGKGVYMNKFN